MSILTRPAWGLFEIRRTDLASQNQKDPSAFCVCIPPRPYQLIVFGYLISLLVVLLWISVNVQTSRPNSTSNFPNQTLTHLFPPQILTMFDSLILMTMVLTPSRYPSPWVARTDPINQSVGFPCSASLVPDTLLVTISLVEWDKTVIMHNIL